MHRTRRFTSVATLVVIVSVPSGCSEINPFETGSTTAQMRQMPDDANEADVVFLQRMIVQLESGQGLTDAALAPGLGVSDDIVLAARHIADEDMGRISKMAELLADWGRERPRSAVAMTPGELQGLARVDFDNQWIALMIEHHEQASTLAERVQLDGTSRAVDNLASGMLVDLRSETSAFATS